MLMFHKAAAFHGNGSINEKNVWQNESEKRMQNSPILDSFCTRISHLNHEK